MAIIIIPAIILMVILGLYEMFLIHHDESFRGSHWLGHGLSTFPTIFIALFAVFNTPYFLDLVGLSGISFFGNEWVVRGLIGFIIMIRIHAQSAVVKATGATGKGMHETFIHSLVIGALIVASPLYWTLLEPLVMNI
ncbi:hypothetical protein J4425_02890, partial [Candidatus Woesearchaeota archaeon]|nr:hypothetical protein [Candidatus Woesearchaeota archaeon]